jgi:hypothetical protein
MMSMKYEKLYTPHQLEIMFAAVRLILIEGHTITLQSFCARAHFKQNQHTRRVLDRLVREGMFASFNVHFSDGHKRKVYCAQNTRSMFEESYSSAEIDHYRLMPQSLAEGYQP